MRLAGVGELDGWILAQGQELVPSPKLELVRQSIEPLGFTSTNRPPPSNILYDSARGFALRKAVSVKANLSFISHLPFWGVSKEHIGNAGRRYPV